MLFCDWKKNRLVEALQLVGGVGQRSEMCEADLPCLHRFQALGQAGSLLANRERVPDGVRVHVAVDADPVARGIEAGCLPLLALSEERGIACEIDLEVVDDAPQALQDEA